MEEDKNLPLILGRPFLATGRALIDVEAVELIMRFQNQHIVFNVFESMKYPSAADEYFSVDVVDELVTDRSYMSLMQDNLEKSSGFNDDVKNLKNYEWVNLMNSFTLIPRNYFEDRKSVG